MGCGKLQTRQGQQWVCDDRVEVDRQMLDKLLVTAGVTFAEGCYATLPCTATTSQHQKPTTKDDNGDDVTIHFRRQHTVIIRLIDYLTEAR